MVQTNKKFLGDHIIENLWRLAVKSPLRFRCVCKDLYTLIRKPSFISKNLRNDHYDWLCIYYFCDDFENEDEIDSKDEIDDHLLDTLFLFPDETLTDLSFKTTNFEVSRSFVEGSLYNGIFCYVE